MIMSQTLIFSNDVRAHSVGAQLKRGLGGLKIASAGVKNAILRQLY